MKTSPKVISLRKRKLQKKYKKGISKINNNKYLLLMIGVPILLAIMLMVDSTINRY